MSMMNNLDEELYDHRLFNFFLCETLNIGLEEARVHAMVKDWDSNPETPDL